MHMKRLLWIDHLGYYNIKMDCHFFVLVSQTVLFITLGIKVHERGQELSEELK